MAKKSKRYRAADAKIERTRRYSLEEAVRTIAAGDGKAKFDETVELAVKLGVDPRQADQNVRGTVVLPHGTGKSVRVLVLARKVLVDEQRHTLGIVRHSTHRDCHHLAGERHQLGFLLFLAGLAPNIQHCARSWRRGVVGEQLRYHENLPWLARQPMAE